MNFIDMFLLNLILVAVPLLIYMVYIITNRNITEKERLLFLNLAVITSYFLMIHYTISYDNTITAFFSGIIIFFLCFNKFYSISFIMMFFTIVLDRYQPLFYIFLGITYVLIILLVLIREYNKLSNNKFVILFTIFYLASFLVFRFMINSSLTDTILLLILFIMMIYIVFIFYQKGIDALNTHLKFKELQKEKQIRLSLFKITHEIKNPIAVCKAYLDMLDVNDVEQVKRYVPIVQGEIERLLGLLQDFLLINKNNMNLDIMDINVLIDDVKNNVSGLMNSNEIDFSINTIDDELFINGDYNRLCQVLVNILKNSVEAEPTKIDLDVMEENDQLSISIKDNGMGIPQDVLDKIYEPFYTTKKCGTGLGVSLSNEIITAHNGTLEYISEVGIGTNVKITLPSYNEL